MDISLAIYHCSHWFLQQILSRTGCCLGEWFAGRFVLWNILVSCSIFIFQQSRPLENCCNCVFYYLCPGDPATVASGFFRVDPKQFYRTDNYRHFVCVVRFFVLFCWQRNWIFVVECFRHTDQGITQIEKNWSVCKKSCYQKFKQSCRKQLYIKNNNIILYIYFSTVKPQANRREHKKNLCQKIKRFRNQN